MRAILPLILVLGVLSPLFAAPWQPFTALTVCPDGRFLATGGMGGEVLWRETLTGEVQGRWLIPRETPVAGLAFNPEGTSLGIAAVDGSGYVVNLSAQEPQPYPLAPGSWPSLSGAGTRWRLVGAPMSGVQVLTRGWVAQGFPDGTIVVRPTEGSGQEVRWKGHQAAVTGLVWSAEGTVLTSCSYDGSLAMWDPRTGKLLARL